MGKSPHRVLWNTVYVIIKAIRKICRGKTSQTWYFGKLHGFSSNLLKIHWISLESLHISHQFIWISIGFPMEITKSCKTYFGHFFPDRFFRMFLLWHKLLIRTPYGLVCPSTPWDSISALSISTYSRVLIMKLQSTLAHLRRHHPLGCNGCVDRWQN